MMMSIMSKKTPVYDHSSVLPLLMPDQISLGDLYWSSWEVSKPVIRKAVGEKLLCNKIQTSKSIHQA